MRLAIENFAKMEGSNKILVLGAMAELGEDSIEEHKTILNELQKYTWKNVLLVGGDFAKIEHPYHQLSSSAEAGEWLRNNKIEQSYLLVKGSRSTQMEKAVEFMQSR